MPLVTGKTKAEHDRKFMEKQSGKSENPKFDFPHYGIGDLVRTETGHMMVTEHDPKGQGYIGHGVNEYGETQEPKRSLAVMHQEVGSGKHHLYAKQGNYPKTKKSMAKEQEDRVKNHPKYERLKNALGKKGAIDALHKELNEK
jgi:hypothetical protein